MYRGLCLLLFSLPANDIRALCLSPLLCFTLCLSVGLSVSLSLCVSHTHTHTNTNTHTCKFRHTHKPASGSFTSDGFSNRPAHNTTHEPSLRRGKTCNTHDPQTHMLSLKHIHSTYTCIHTGLALCRGLQLTSSHLKLTHQHKCYTSST